MEKKHIYYGLGAIAVIGLAIWAFKEKNENPLSDSKAPPATPLTPTPETVVKPTATSGFSGKKGRMTYAQTGFDGNKVFLQPVGFPNYDYVGWYGADAGYYGANAGYTGGANQNRVYVPSRNR